MRVIVSLLIIIGCIVCAYINGYNNGAIDSQLEERWKKQYDRENNESE